MRNGFGRWSVVGPLVSVCLLGTVGALAQSEPGPSNGQTAAKIIAKMLEMNRERQEALDGYTSDRTYQVHYAGTGGEHNAEIHVHAEYVGPDRKKLTVVSESGSKFICEKVLRKIVDGEMEASGKANRMQMTLSPDNYDAKLVGEEVVGTPDGGPGVRAWVLDVTPKVDNKFTYRGKVWISEDDFAIMRIHAEPAKNPSWWINKASFDARYVRRGEMWLPGKNVSSSHVRIGGEATLTIDYGSYPVVAARALKAPTQSANVPALQDMNRR